MKLWAKYQDINNAKNMTISSYSLALMVIHFLQNGVSPCVLPCLHTMYPGKFQVSGQEILFGCCGVTKYNSIVNFHQNQSNYKYCLFW